MRRLDLKRGWREYKQHERDGHAHSPSPKGPRRIDSAAPQLGGGAIAKNDDN